MKTTIPLGKSSLAIAARKARLPLLLLVASFRLASAAQPPHIAVVHWEFKEDFVPRCDSLLWRDDVNSAAVQYKILRVRGNDGGTFIATVKNFSGSGGTYLAPVFQTPGEKVTYSVVGVDARGNFLQFSNGASATQLLRDPGFNAGPNSPSWTQVYSTDQGTFDVNYIDGTPGDYTAFLGDFTSEIDTISTALSVPVVPLNALNPTVDLIFDVNVSTQEDVNETNAYDTLTVQLVDAASGDVLFTDTVADNRDVGKGRRNFVRTVDYNAVKGKSVNLVFSTSNDEILSTLFMVSHAQLNLLSE